MVDPDKANFGGLPIAAWRHSPGRAPADAAARPVVSIVTPFHCPGMLFRETVQSVLAQTLAQWEWLIVDDGSQDESSRELLEDVARDDVRIRVLTMVDNRGRSAARNHGIAAARSDLIFMLDHDDLLECSALEKCFWYLVAHPEQGFVNGWSVAFGAKRLLWDRGFERREDFLVENQVSGRALVRRAVLEQVGGYDDALIEGFEDWDLWLRCADHGIWGATIPEYLDWFRRHDPPAAWERPGAAETFRERLAERHPDLFTGVFPEIPRRDPLSDEPPPCDPPCANRLVARERCLLIFVARLTAEAGGALLLQAVEQLSRQGWSITLAALQAGPGSAAFSRSCADIHVLDRFLPPDQMPRFLAYLMGSRGHDRVLVEAGPLAGPITAFLRGRFPDAGYLAFVHDDPDDVVEPLRAVDVAKLGLLVDRLLVTCESLRDALVALGTDAERIDVVTPGVDTAVWQPAESPRGWLRERWGAEPDETVILYWGGLGDRVRISVLCAVLRELDQRALRHRVILIADGPASNDVKGYIERHALGGRVQFHLPAEPASELKALAAADLFLAPLRGGTSVATVRALAVGLPVLTAAVGGQGDLVDETCGVLVQPADERSEVAAYADAIEELIHDPARRRKLSAMARTRALSHLGTDRLIAGFGSALAAVPCSSWRPRKLPATDVAYQRAVQRFRMVVRGESMRVERDRLDALATEQARVLRDLRRWAEQLDEARKWLDDERRSWERVAGEHAERASSTERNIERLEEARVWYEEQNEHWKQIAEAHESQIDELEALRVWLDSDRRSQAALSSERQVRIELLEEMLARRSSNAPDRSAADLERRLWALFDEKTALAARLEALLER